MKIGWLSDTQTATGETMRKDPVADHDALWQRTADIFEEHDVDVIVHGGDVFQQRTPTNRERMVFKRWLDRVAKRHRVVVVAGNHDIAHVSEPGPVDLYRYPGFVREPFVYHEFEFVRSPQVLDLGGCLLACLPWAPTSGLRARTDGHEDVNRIAVDFLLREAEKLYESAAGTSGNGGQSPSASRPQKPRLLATHFLLDPTWNMEFVGKPVLPVAVLEAQGWDLIVAGDDHASGWRGERTLSLGSPWVCSFGETEYEHGVWIVDTTLTEPGLSGAASSRDAVLVGADESRRPGSVSVEFVPVPDRKFVSIAVDLTALGKAAAVGEAAGSSSAAEDGELERAAVSPSVAEVVR